VAVRLCEIKLILHNLVIELITLLNYNFGKLVETIQLHSSTSRRATYANYNCIEIQFWEGNAQRLQMNINMIIHNIQIISLMCTKIEHNYLTLFEFNCILVTVFESISYSI